MLPHKAPEPTRHLLPCQGAFPAPAVCRTWHLPLDSILHSTAIRPCTSFTSTSHGSPGLQPRAGHRPESLASAGPAPYTPHTLHTAPHTAPYTGRSGKGPLCLERRTFAPYVKQLPCQCSQGRAGARRPAEKHQPQRLPLRHDRFLLWEHTSFPWQKSLPE